MLKHTRNILRFFGAFIPIASLLSFQVPGTEYTNNKNSINLEFSGYDISDGLSSNVAYAILEDIRGFIWIGTQDGLNRFDGYDFAVYGVGTEGGNFISRSGINALLEDQDGYLWIGTEGGGLNCYDPETERFWYYFHDPDDPVSLSSNTITSLIEDTDGTVWVGTSNGLNQMQKTFTNRTKDKYIKPISCKFIRFYQNTDTSSLSSSRISCMYMDSYQHLWVGTENGLNLFRPEAGNQLGGNFISYTTDTNSAFILSHNNINAVYEDKNGSLWVGTNKGVTQLTARGNNGIPTESRQIMLVSGQQLSVGHNRVYDIIDDQVV
jgi:ligand-binding sensor domain-containing protein